MVATIGSAQQASIEFDQARERFRRALDALVREPADGERPATPGDGTGDGRVRDGSGDGSRDGHEAAVLDLADAMSALEASGQQLTTAIVADMVREAVIGHREPSADD